MSLDREWHRPFDSLDNRRSFGLTLGAKVVRLGTVRTTGEVSAMSRDSHLCSWCWKVRQVRRDGRLRFHPQGAPSSCPGSLQPIAAHDRELIRQVRREYGYR